MEWIVAVVTLVVCFTLERTYEWYKKWKAGLTGQAHDIIAKLGRSVQSFTGNYFLSFDSTGNFKIASHVYQHATGDVIGTCFRESPVCYGEQDLARLLPKGTSFARLTTDGVCSDTDRIQAEAVLRKFVQNAKIVCVPSGNYFSNIDGIFTKLQDGTHIAFITFPGTGTKYDNRGIVFYGHTAKAFFEYFRDLRDASATVLKK